MKTDSALWAAIRSIAKQWQSRQEDIRSFAETKYSFEEWLNWEAFCACKSQHLKVTPKPTYPRSQKQADLRIELDGKKFIWIEIALVHDGTIKRKWLEKLKHDQQKLRRIKPQQDHLIQLIVVACRNEANLTWWQEKGFPRLKQQIEVLPPLRIWPTKPQGSILAWKI